VIIELLVLLSAKEVKYMSWTETQKKYDHSEKGKASRQRYFMSEKGKATKARYMAKRKAKLQEMKKQKILNTKVVLSEPKINKKVNRITLNY